MKRREMVNWMAEHAIGIVEVAIILTLILGALLIVQHLDMTAYLGQ